MSRQRSSRRHEPDRVVQHAGQIHHISDRSVEAPPSGEVVLVLDQDDSRGLGIRGKIVAHRLPRSRLRVEERGCFDLHSTTGVSRPQRRWFSGGAEEGAHGHADENVAQVVHAGVHAGRCHDRRCATQRKLERRQQVSDGNGKRGGDAE